MAVSFDRNNVNYILRTYLPYWRFDERLEELIRFCRETGTRHVLLFTDAQHMVWNQLTLTEAEHEAATIAKARLRLAAEGIRTGINSSYNMAQSQWDNRPHSHYQYWATCADGTCNYRTPCLLDPALETYLDRFYRILAGAGPDYIYVDDDHRYGLQGIHGTWGCFCELHLRRFSDLTGRTWTRSELTAALKADPAVRARWIDFLGRRLVQLAAIIEHAVHAVNPAITVGMMVPCVHPLTTMGHRITNVLEAFAPAGRPLVRPCIGPYSDHSRQQIIPGLFYLEYLGHLLGDGTDYTPEIETTPFTRLAKSMTTVRFHITQGLLNRMNNPAISACGYVGDSPFLEPAFVPLLRDNRNFFEAVRKLAPARGTRKGIQLLWQPDSARTAQRPIGNVTDLYWPAFVVHQVLGNLGFSLTYDESPVRFLAGDTVRCLEPSRLAEILRGGVILDPVAAQALNQMGFSDAVGCDVGKPVTFYGAEELTDPGINGPFTGTYIPLKGAPPGQVFRLLPAPTARTVSRIVDHDLKPLAPGVVLQVNATGGKVAVLPYLFHPCAGDLRHLICYHRRQMLKAILDWMQPGVLPVWVVTPTDIAVQTWDDGRRLTVCLTNLSSDPATELILHLPARFTPDRAWMLAKTGRKRRLGKSLACQAADNGMILGKLTLRLTAFDPLILVLES